MYGLAKVDRESRMILKIYEYNNSICQYGQYDHLVWEISEFVLSIARILWSSKDWTVPSPLQ